MAARHAPEDQAEDPEQERQAARERRDVHEPAHIAEAQGQVRRTGDDQVLESGDAHARHAEQPDHHQHPEPEQLLSHPGAALAVVDAAERSVERPLKRAREPRRRHDGDDPDRRRGLAHAPQAVDQRRAGGLREQALQVLYDRGLDLIPGKDRAATKSATSASGNTDSIRL